MVERFPHYRLQIILLLTLVVLVCSGLQVATATSLQQGPLCDPTVRTDDCHLVFVQPQAATCCPSQACHKTTPTPRDLGTPEYHNQLKSAHPLVHESRNPVPELKAGQAIISSYATLNTSTSRPSSPLNTLQSLVSLRSVVLLH